MAQGKRSMDERKRDKLLNRIARGQLDLYCVGSDFLNDRTFLLTALSSAPSGIGASHVLKDLPAVLRADPEIIRAAVANSGCALQHASEELRHNKSIVLEAVTSEGYAFEYAAGHLRCDREVALQAVSSCGDALRFASAELRADETVVSTAVESSGAALKYACTELKANQAVVLLAVSNSHMAITFAAEELRRDSEFIKASVETNPLSFEFVPDEFRTKKDIVLAAVTINGHALQYAASDLRGDKEVLKAAVTNAGVGVLKWATNKDELYADLSFVAHAMQSIHVANGKNDFAVLLEPFPSSLAQKLCTLLRSVLALISEEGRTSPGHIMALHPEAFADQWLAEVTETQRAASVIFTQAKLAPDTDTDIREYHNSEAELALARQMKEYAPVIAALLKPREGVTELCWSEKALNFVQWYEKAGRWYDDDDDDEGSFETDDENEGSFESEDDASDSSDDNWQESIRGSPWHYYSD